MLDGTMEAGKWVGKGITEKSTNRDRHARIFRKITNRGRDQSGTSFFRSSSSVKFAALPIQRS